MSSRQRPPIRHCPICGIAMQASKSQENLAYFDKFECLSCHTVITTESKPRPPTGQHKPR
jgi:C4-type Zn-finger protein